MATKTETEKATKKVIDANKAANEVGPIREEKEVEVKRKGTVRFKINEAQKVKVSGEVWGDGMEYLGVNQSTGIVKIAGGEIGSTYFKEQKHGRGRRQFDEKVELTPGMYMLQVKGTNKYAGGKAKVEYYYRNFEKEKKLKAQKNGNQQSNGQILNLSRAFEVMKSNKEALAVAATIGMGAFWLGRR